MDGVGSSLATANLTTGGTGSGNIAVTAGGELWVGGDTIIGRDQASQGAISIDGTQSKFLLHDATIGQSGTGTLTLSGGSTTTADTILVGFAAGGAGTLNVNGATARLSGLIIGQGGSGQATFNGGSTISTQNVTIGADAGANGSVSVADSGTTLRALFLSIGTLASGQLSASKGAAVSVSSITIGGAGSLSLASGATLSSSALDVEPQGQLSLDGEGTKYTMTANPVSILGAATVSGGACGPPRPRSTSANTEPTTPR